MDQLQSFVDFLREKLTNGELLEEWDDSLVGMDHEYDLGGEEDVTSIAAFGMRLAEFLQRNYRKV